MTAIRRVGVVGAGLAGRAAAVAATRAGLQVQVFEAAAALPQPQAHLDVVPNLLRDLATLGVADACLRQGFPYHTMVAVDTGGRTLFEVPTPALAGPQLPPALGMVYGDLLDLLRRAAEAGGARIQAGCAVLDSDADGRITTADGRRHVVDLVVLACGSQVPAQRGQPAAALPLQTLDQRWCHALLPRPPALERATWVMGSGHCKALAVPVDLRRAGLAVMLPAGMDAMPAALRSHLAGQGTLLQALAAQWHDDTPVLLRTVRSGLLAGPWHDGALLRIGQSAHVLPPQFGQAAAQAVEDAVVLGDLLRQDLPRADLLQAFMARRGPRAGAVQALVTQAALWDLQPESRTDLPALAARLAPLLAQPA